ncbi:restriction endonuclease subunit S [Humibacter sp. RRB41]|uniref:restriction endonuclease subunit S n=1 Tax=Humibacter sp. RRB41 TaxID=2919946 RepID=UPI001FA9D4A4|nr:restriction endonuclease subunit S [Humibacter sp. RRB41]
MFETTLGALANANVLDLGDGYRTKQAELATGGFRIIRVADVRGGRIGLESPDFVSDQYARQIGSKVATPGDVLLTTKGTIGRVAIVPDVVSRAVYSPQLCWFRIKKPDVVNARYLSYWLQSPAFRRQSSHMQGNTDMAPYISLSDLRTASITIPPLSEQQAIAEVLSALDDKIAANASFSESAIAMARIEFRARASTIPYGAQTFSDLAEISGGGTPSTKNPSLWDGSIHWATPTDLTALAGPYLESTSRTITESGLKSCSSKLFEPGAILMTSRATIGVLAVNGSRTAVNQGFIVVEPHDEALRWWLFHEMESRVDEFISWANGATFLELSRGNFRKLPLRVPDSITLAAFDSVAEPLHALARAKLKENRILTETRDALLPQLMSGKLRVRDAEAAASAAGV